MGKQLKDMNDKLVDIDYVEVICHHFTPLPCPTYFLTGENYLSGSRYNLDILTGETDYQKVVEFCDKANKINESIKQERQKSVQQELPEQSVDDSSLHEDMEMGD